MNARGVTLLESLIALVLGSVVLLGVGSFYVATKRFSGQASGQTFLQRQGVFILEEMGRQVRSATSLAGNCNGSNSLQVINASGTFCFSRPDSTHLNKVLSGGGTANLLTGSPVPLTVSNFVPTVIGSVATVSFQLQDNRQNSMTFTTALGCRNCS
jgi:prepilin-type N-terminal cleavage/methylation domain-containing protein